VKARLVRSEPGRIFILRFERGDAFVESLTRFAGEQKTSSARIEGIGAFTEARLGFYDLERKDYDRFSVDEGTEVLSLLGNVTLKDGRPWVHAHVALSRRDGSAVGGHLFEGLVAATLEVFVSEIPGELVREKDDEVGLALIRP
jgi:uncharacterized protein